MNQVVRIALVLMFSLVAIPMTRGVSAQEAVILGESWPTQGWPTALPEEAGMDPGMLAWAAERMATETPLLSAMVVVRNGHIVLEQYQNDFAPDERFHIWSVSKSVTDIAVGMALDEGVLTSLDQTLGELIPHRIPADADPRVWNVTIEQLLTMTAGWAWDGRVNFARAAETDDLDLMLSRPMQCDPGTCFEYDSGCSNILSYIIQERTGLLMADYLQTRLFQPLGVEDPYWLTTHDGATRGGGGLRLTPREMAKIGYLYLHEGRWGDRQIVSPWWVAQSTQQHASGIGHLGGVVIGPGAYGYHWWIAQPNGLPAFVASGYGGQLIYVVPALDLVVVTAYAGADPTRPDLQQHTQSIIEEAIVPAVVADPAFLGASIPEGAT